VGRATGRFVKFALSSFLTTRFGVSFSVLGLLAVWPVVQWLGWSWSGLIALTSFAACSFVGGVRLERELRGDAEISVTHSANGQELRLTVTNHGARTARFRARVVVKTRPILPSRSEWYVPWEGGVGSDAEIPGRGDRDLLLGVASLTRRTDGLLGGSVAFTTTDASVPFTYEITDADYLKEDPVRVKVRIDRMDRPKGVVHCFEIELPYEAVRSGIAYPVLREVGNID
jgi:hypothetical protein